MGIGCRVFLIDDNDTIHRLPRSRYERLLGGAPGEQLPQYAGKRVRCAVVYLETEGRKPQSIIRIDYQIIPLDEQGRIDKPEQEKEMRLAFESISPLSSILKEERPGKIIDARSRFARKRYEQEFKWSPGPGIQATIITAIFGPGYS